jgi:hypothetical protein
MTIGRPVDFLARLLRTRGHGSFSVFVGPSVSANVDALLTCHEELVVSVAIHERGVACPAGPLTRYPARNTTRPARPPQRPTQ